MKRFFTFSILLVLSFYLFGIPADKKPITIKQPNGKTLTFILCGDERISWAKTLDEYSLLYNKVGNWVYAMIDENGDMIPSNLLACNKEERNKEELEFLVDIKPNLFYSQKQIDIFLGKIEKENDIRQNFQKEEEEKISDNQKEIKKKRCCIFKKCKNKATTK